MPHDLCLAFLTGWFTGARETLGLRDGLDQTNLSWRCNSIQSVLPYTENTPGNTEIATDSVSCKHNQPVESHGNGKKVGYFYSHASSEPTAQQF